MFRTTRKWQRLVLTKTRQIRGECLSNSDLIRTTHNSFARASPFVDETQRTAGDDDDVYHFIAYTPINGTLYELDGLKPSPISHGACSADQFSQKIVPVLQRRIEKYPLGEIRFNLIAMIQDPRIRAREIGDVETLRIEETKRRGWVWENALRRHNFVGFVGDLTKGVVRAKLVEGDEKYKEWVDSAKKRTESRLKKGKGGLSEEDMS
jgi:ubiquitin carboxyl-terminal hydrolase L5